MDIDEGNFIEELKNRNEDALYFVIDNYLAIIKTVTNRHLFYLEDRKEECVNDCLLAVWENIHSYDPKRSSFKNWIAGIAKYKSIDYVRKYLKDRDIENIDDKIIESDEDSLNKLIEKEFNRQVDDLLSNLSREDQKIFIETYFNNKSAEDISKEVDLKESAIYNRLSRGRKKLRLLMGGNKNER